MKNRHKPKKSTDIIEPLSFESDRHELYDPATGTVTFHDTPLRITVEKNTQGVPNWIIDPDTSPEKKILGEPPRMIEPGDGYFVKFYEGLPFEPREIPMRIVAHTHNMIELRGYRYTQGGGSWEGWRVETDLSDHSLKVYHSHGKVTKCIMAKTVRRPYPPHIAFYHMYNDNKD